MLVMRKFQHQKYVAGKKLDANEDSKSQNKAPQSSNTLNKNDDKTVQTRDDM